MKRKKLTKIFMMILNFKLKKPFRLHGLYKHISVLLGLIHEQHIIKILSN